MLSGPQRGVALGFLAYAIYCSSDTAVKAIGHSLPLYQIAFFGGLLGLPLVFLVKPRGMPILHMFRVNRWWLILIRGMSGTCAGLLGTIAFQNLPFAEAYCILFLAPSFSVIWSKLFLKEEVDAWRWLSIGVGLFGVIVVVRPTFDTLQWAHLAAVASALASSCTIVLLRSIARTEHPTAMMLYATSVGLVFNGVMMVPSFQMPTMVQWGLLIPYAVGSGIGGLLLIAASKITPASQIVPTQYSQIGWALAIGATLFGEYPDRIALIGIGLVVASGLLNLANGKPAPVAAPKPTEEPTTLLLRRSGGPAAAVSAGPVAITAQAVR